MKFGVEELLPLKKKKKKKKKKKERKKKELLPRSRQKVTTLKAITVYDHGFPPFSAA